MAWPRLSRRDSMACCCHGRDTGKTCSALRRRHTPFLFKRGFARAPSVPRKLGPFDAPLVLVFHTSKKGLAMLSINASKPFVVGIGGTAQPNSSTEKALGIALSSAERAGARVQLFGGDLLTQLPHYLTAEVASSPAAVTLLAAVRAADGVIIASPGYHGS